MRRDKIETVLFGFVLSGLMSLVVSGISTARVVGLDDRLVGLWAGAWVMAWAVAFPVVLVAAPMARKVVQRVTSRARTMPPCPNSSSPPT